MLPPTAPSYSVTDSGIKALLLRNPERHILRKGRNLHELRVRSMHLNPCSSGLHEVSKPQERVGSFPFASFLAAPTLSHITLFDILGI